MSFYDLYNFFQSTWYAMENYRTKTNAAENHNCMNFIKQTTKPFFKQRAKWTFGAI